jgi:hypothetical protein
MALTSTLTGLVLAPLILLCSLLLLPFAIVTTTLAISTLFVRVLAVYLELFLAITHDQFSTFKYAPSTTLKRKKRPSLDRSLSNSSARHASRSSHTAIYAPNVPLVRDYEGVGGWRISAGDETDNDWVTMNTRLELPAVSVLPVERKRRHQRSLTHGAFGEKSGLRRTKVSGRPRSAMASGTITPEEKQRGIGRTKSEIGLGEIDMNIGRSRVAASRQHSSSSSNGSARTIVMAGTRG